MRQVTRDQHFVPRFYLHLFADGDRIQILDVKRLRIAKPRPFASVCYKPFFYGGVTGRNDEISQACEEFFSALETKIHSCLPGVIAHAHACTLNDDDFNTLSFFMSLQWLRTEQFRERVLKVAGDAYKHIMEIEASLPTFSDIVRRFAEERGKTYSQERVDAIRDATLSGDYNLKFSNRLHLEMLIEGIQGYRNLFFHKQWNILRACGEYRFVTSDDPVVEWTPKRKRLFGVPFLRRKHYLPLTPDLLIETAAHTDESLTATPSQTVAYRNCVDDDEVLMFDILIASYAHRFVYAKGTGELRGLVRQSATPETAVAMYRTNYC